MHIVRRALAVTAVLATAALGSGCYSYVDTETPVYAAGEVDGYAPAYYDGYVVYYDTGGRPYYYDNGGAALWVSTGSPYYPGLVNHWHVYGRAYPGWYAHSGYRYRSYRAAPAYHAYYGHGGYRGYHGGYHGAPSHHASRGGGRRR